MSYARNLWYAVMWADRLEPGEMRSVTVCEQDVIIFRQLNGDIGALDDRCSHRFAPLSRGTMCAEPDGSSSIECPYHGLRFGNDGSCVANPHGSGRIPSSLNIRAYALAERHSMIWMWLGDEPSDPNRIPDYSYLDADAPGIVSKRDTLTMNVDYQLVIDNLLDLSHAAFLHKNTLGNKGTSDADVTIDEGPTWVSVARTASAIEPPELFDLMFRNDGEPIDFWSIMRWDAPSCLRHDSGAHAPGTERTTGMTVIGTHLVTPAGKGSCTYHVAAVRLGDDRSDDQSVGRTHGDDDPVIAERLSAMRRFAFEEQDKPILEAQQRAYDAVGGFEAARPVMLTIDAGPLRARRVLKRIVERENTRRSIPFAIAGD